MIQIRNIPQKYLNVLYVLLALFVYNSIVLYKYFNFGIFTRNYIMAQYAFTYQEMGFVARGFIPSIFSVFGINNQISYFILFNVIIVCYVFTIIKIANMYQLQHKNYFIISFLFLFFGIPHFALDAFRLDSIIQFCVLWVFIFLHQNKTLIAFTIGILAMFIHEAVLFLLVPIFFLYYNQLSIKKCVLIAFVFVIIFFAIIFMSNKTNEIHAIELIQNFLKIEDVPKEIYALNVQSTQSAHFSMFKTYNIAIFVVYGLIYLGLAFTIFSKLFKNGNLIIKLMFLAPLSLCFLGVDFFRWYCFMFFLLMIFNLFFEKEIDKKIVSRLFYTTILLGIPVSIEIKFGLVPLFFHYISKIL